MSEATGLADHFRQALEDCDVATVRKLWAHVRPSMPQPSTDFHALATIHHARTMAPFIRLRHRAYSHRWLLDHGIPSALPDELKPKCERMYPETVTGVGISVNVRSRSRSIRQLGVAIRGAMEGAVEECYADHQTEPSFVKARMMEARDKVLKSD